MRRWLADRLRLALRKVLPRVMAFACSPTQAEIRQIVESITSPPLVLYRSGEAMPVGRQKLH